MKTNWQIMEYSQGNKHIYRLYKRDKDNKLRTFDKTFYVRTEAIEKMNELNKQETNIR